MSTTIKEYKDAYRKANDGEEATIDYRGGWVTIYPSGTKVRLRELPELTEVLRKRTIRKLNEMSFPYSEKFLDYEIHNSGNSDGFVLLKNGVGANWECHLGNYKTLDDARDSAILYFMIARPNKFHSSIFHRLIGSKTYYEWYTFKKVVEEEGLNLPIGIYCRGMSCTIGTDFDSFIKSKEWEKNDNGN